MRPANREAGSLLVFFAKIAAASAVGALACFELLTWLETRIAWRTTHGAFAVLVAASLAGLLVTAALAKLVRVRELDAYLKKLHP